MKRTILLLFITLGTFTSYGQNSTDELTNKFIELYEKDTDAAFDFIFGTNKWMKDGGTGTEKMKFQLREYAKLMGNYIGFEKLTEKSLGKSLKVLVYIVKYERQPLRFIFKYYKAKDNWSIFNIKFDDDIDDELDEIMKYDYLTGN